MEPLAQAAESRMPLRVRPGLQQILALLVVNPSLEEIMAAAERLDLRDLSEHEIAWLEDVSLSTVRKWRHRGEGIGPDYRLSGGRCLYPIRWYLEWRDGGRQSGTAAGVRRGRRARALREAG